MTQIHAEFHKLSSKICHNINSYYMWSLNVQDLFLKNHNNKGELKNSIKIRAYISSLGVIPGATQSPEYHWVALEGPEHHLCSVVPVQQGTKNTTSPDHNWSSWLSIPGRNSHNNFPKIQNHLFISVDGSGNGHTQWWLALLF